ncbi:SsrA-binding protein SmpB [Sodalis-like secondary symbiont of Drepanosiphum platanoidis]|uniref:SsrA-binding protein SmpB n=1 Tax=Sodalis-like secondary symbiont of Drepanosiphum platanoidis TaxID=2994493 RepID=UPI0034649776
MNNKSITKNKSAYYKYFIEKKIESGLLLKGWEVKSSRANRVDIKNSYISIKNNEAFLLGANFNPLINHFNLKEYDYIRTRKILLNKSELIFLKNQINIKKKTIIALELYWKKCWIKLKIAVVKGKKQYDKRMSIKNKDWKIEKKRILKNKNNFL